MNLQAVFTAIDGDWYQPPGGVGPEALDAALLERAAASALGRRMLARWLMAQVDGALFAPRPDRALPAAVLRWPRAALAPLLRDLGVLAHAPAVRAEVRREPVRQLRRVLGNSYLLALDKQVWDGEVDDALAARLREALGTALRARGDDAPVLALFERQGRGELQAWAARHDPALAEWALLQFPREPLPTAHLPETQVRFLHDHHLARLRAA